MRNIDPKNIFSAFFLAFSFEPLMGTALLTLPDTCSCSSPAEPPACPAGGQAALWASCRRRAPCRPVTASSPTGRTAGERSAPCGWPCLPGPGTQPWRRTRTCEGPGSAPSATADEGQGTVGHLHTGWSSLELRTSLMSDYVYRDQPLKVWRMNTTKHDERNENFSLLHNYIHLSHIFDVFSI